MLQRPKIQLRYGRINQPIRISLADLLIDNISTITSADIASNSSTLTVKNILGFAINQILFIGTLGLKGSEIVKTSTSVAPTGSTITLTTGTLQPHSSSTNVYVINYDQVEISWSATVNGTKTVLTTINLLGDSDETIYFDNNTSGFYFARFKNSIIATFSDYSDPAPINGYTTMSARSIIDDAKMTINKEKSTLLSDEYSFKQIDNCQMECLREFKRWSFMQSFDTNLGNTSEGTWKIPLPVDCDDQNTTKSVYQFRIGKEDPMVWVDKERWNYVIDSTAYTTLKNTLNIGDSTITLTDSSDFDNSGTVQVGANQLSYTDNNKSTGILTLSSNSTVTGIIGQDIFQAASLGNPTYFTIYNGTIFHWPVTSSTYANRNYVLDYYKSLTQIQHDSDIIILPDSTLVQYYLCWKFLLRINNGEETEGSKAHYANYILRREKMKQKESLNRQFILNPNVDTGNPFN